LEHSEEEWNADCGVVTFGAGKGVLREVHHFSPPPAANGI